MDSVVGPVRTQVCKGQDRTPDSLITNVVHVVSVLQKEPELLATKLYILYKMKYLLKGNIGQQVV